MKSFDIAVLGSGPGGYVGAIRAAQLGASVVVIENENIGGVCLNWGCIPTKTLIHSADVYSSAREAADFGVSISGEITVDWPTMTKRKDTVVGTLCKGVGSLLKSNGVPVIKGTAGFVNRGTLEVTDESGATQQIRAAKTIVATGGKPVWPGFLPPQSPRLMTSRGALTMAALPSSLLVLGGGIIGCEWACMFARLGVSVTVVEMLPSILPQQDKETARIVAQSMKKLGIDLRTSSRMDSVEDTGKGINAAVGDDTIEADCMLVSVGRTARTDGLHPENAGLELDESGCIPVDERCSTVVPGIYAIGDVTGGIQLAHRASAMGICAAENAAGERSRHDDSLVPSCIFTTPEIGAVGLTVEQAKNNGHTVRSGKFPFQALGKALAIGETGGFSKIVADAETDQVLGVHIVGPHATDLISEAAAAMKLEITAEELGRVIHPHPTLSESVMEAAHAVHGTCIHAPPLRKKRSS